MPVHAAGVVHRDIKPGNLLFDGEGRVRVADFGIARLVGDTVRATATGTMVGTVTYVAPEQTSGDEVGTAADIYALGLVLLSDYGTLASAGHPPRRPWPASRTTQPYPTTCPTPSGGCSAR